MQGGRLHRRAFPRTNNLVTHRFFCLPRLEPKKLVVGVTSFVAETDPNRTVLHSCDLHNKAYYMRLTFFMDWITELAGDDELCVFKKKIIRDYRIHQDV